MQPKYIHTYIQPVTYTGKLMDVCLKGSGHLHICGGQTNPNIAQIWLFFDDLLTLLYHSGIWLAEICPLPVMVCLLLEEHARLPDIALL